MWNASKVEVITHLLGSQHSHYKMQIGRKKIPLLFPHNYRTLAGNADSDRMMKKETRNYNSINQFKVASASSGVANVGKPHDAIQRS